MKSIKSNFQRDKENYKIYNYPLYIEYESNSILEEGTGEYIVLSDELFNGENSMAAYYREASYGKLNIKSHFFPPSRIARTFTFQNAIEAFQNVVTVSSKQ